MLKKALLLPILLAASTIVVVLLRSCTSINYNVVNCIFYAIKYCFFAVLCVPFCYTSLHREYDLFLYNGKETATTHLMKGERSPENFHFNPENFREYEERVSEINFAIQS